MKNLMTAALSKATHLNGSLLQPIVNISPTRNGRTKINFGDRKFFSGTVSIEVDGQPKRIQVVAERNFRDGDKTMSRQAFYPLDSNLKPDMSTALYKKDNGEWGIADRKDAAIRRISGYQPTRSTESRRRASRPVPPRRRPGILRRADDAEF
ncbi:hypothetical protein [Paraburkholderia aspalathi]|uniref:hypothetical protein n=1 Tax=Paraburkholderia aspalathi TaxID=1324617 RepID=UPI0038BAE421